MIIVPESFMDTPPTNPDRPEEPGQVPSPPEPPAPDASVPEPVFPQPPEPSGGISFVPETFVIPPISPVETQSGQGEALRGTPQPEPGPPEAPRPPGNKAKRLLIRGGIFVLVLFIILFLVRVVGGILAKNRVVTVIYWGLWESSPIMSRVISDFEAQNPKIKVEYVSQSPKQYRERLQAAINREDGPDVFRFHNTWVPMLKNQLSSVPTTVITANQFSSTFYPVVSADLVIGSTIYGIPLMIDGLGLYYNEDLLTSAGVTPPTTWPEVLNIVPRLTVKNESTIVTSAIALGTTGNVEHASDILAVMMMQNGADLTVPTGKEAEETILFYRKFADPSDPVYTWNESMDNNVYAFATGRVAMILAPSWRAFDVKQISPNLRFKIVAIPQLPGSTVTWASYWVEGVSVKSKHPEQAWKFVKFLTSRETATKLYTEAAKTRLFGEPYARVDLKDSVAADPYVGAYVAQATSAKSFPLASRTFDNGINDKLIKYIEDAVNAVAGGSAPSAALETAATGFRQVLGTYGVSSAAAPGTR